jgi:hypothetical protein
MAWYWWVSIIYVVGAIVTWRVVLGHIVTGYQKQAAACARCASPEVGVTVLCHRSVHRDPWDKKNWSGDDQDRLFWTWLCWPFLAVLIPSFVVLHAALFPFGHTTRYSRQLERQRKAEQQRIAQLQQVEAVHEAFDLAPPTFWKEISR